MKIQFYAGEGRYFKSVNYLFGKDDEKTIYAEIEAPEGCTEDYGYLTMKKALMDRLPGEVARGLEWQYDGQEQYLADDASADGEVYTDFYFEEE